MNKRRERRRREIKRGVVEITEKEEAGRRRKIRKIGV